MTLFVFFFPGIVMGEEGFADMAGILGAYVHLIVKEKEKSFTKARVDFSQENVRGDLLDADEN